MSFTNNTIFNRLIVPASFIATVYGGVALYKETRYKVCPSKCSMEGKNVIITGANSGIGLETTKELAKRGATIVMGCRHMGKCETAARKLREETNNKQIVCRFIDLANLDSVEEFASNIRKELSHIDVLINNAGVMKPQPPLATPTTDDGFDRQLGINHLGHFLLTNLLIDKMITPPQRESPSRVINVSSIAYKEGEIDFDDINKEKNKKLTEDERLTELYYQSKLANIAFTQSLHEKYQHVITSNCLHPGVSDTNISRYRSVPFYAVGQVFMVPIKWVLLKTARQGAQTSIYLASDQDLQQTSGTYFDDCEAVTKTHEMCKEQTCQQLWQLSEEWTDLNRRLQNIKQKEQQQKGQQQNEEQQKEQQQKGQQQKGQQQKELQQNEE